MEAGVLGPLRVRGPHAEIAITGVKERTVVAHLVARVGQVVATEELIDALWPDEPPRTARRTLQSYVARVRTALEQAGVEEGLLSSQSSGYRLSMDPTGIDANQFARLVELGRRAAGDGNPREAVRSLQAALALWRGPAYAGFEATSFGRAERRRLDELRVAATEDLYAAQIASGSVAVAIPELEAHVARHPLREHAWALLVRAHAAADNQAAALEALERARTVLADELGVDPGEELRALLQRVLAQDPTLAPRSALPPELLPAAAPLVGRDAEWAALRALWPPPPGGPGRRVLLLGEHGSGRWRMACELSATAHAKGGRVVLGAQTPASAGRPLLRVVDARGGDVGELSDPVGLGLQVPAPGELQLVVAPSAWQAGPDDVVVRLYPLTVEQVGELLASYLPAGSASSDDPVTVAAAADIHARSGGNVARARDLAVRWARELVAARVAVRSASTSEAATATEAQRAALADEVAHWTQLGVDHHPDDHSCPWRGLASYAEGDAAWFSGRERLTAELVARIGAERAVLLVGGSGSGKSSLLRAGLLASLAGGALPGSAGWVRIALRPGQHPMRELTEAALAGAGNTGPDRVADLLSRSLEQRGGSERILLVVDQFEECWTVCDDPGEREAFLATIAGLARDAALPATVVLAVRADHAGSIASHAGLAEVLAGRAVFVAPMVEGELRRAIEGPATRAGLALDVGLADALVADTLAEPGGLPLLSTALESLWQDRADRRLSLAGYAVSGGVGAAIARMAERAFAGLDQAQQRACRVLLARLAGPGQGDGVVRRRVDLDELAALPDPSVLFCVEPLVTARLLTVSDGHVEVAHEALFRSWPRLREWLAEDAVTRDVQRRLTAAAVEWDREGRDPAGLWGGARLASAVEVTTAHPEQFTGVEAAFVEASTARLDAERAEADERARAAQRQNRRLRRLLAGLGITLALAILAGSLAVASRNEAAAQRETATAQRLAATASSEDYLAERMLTAVEAVRTEESPQTVGALLSVLAANPAIVDRIDTPNRLLGAAAAPGSNQAVAIANLEDVHLFDMVTGEDRVLWSRADANITDLRVSPDGRYAAFALGSWAGARPPELAVLDLTTAEIVWTREIEGDPVVLATGWDFTDIPGQLAVATVAGIDLVQVDGAAADRTIPLDPVEPQFRMMRRAEDRMVLFAGQGLPARLVDLRTGEGEELPDSVGGRGSVSPDGRYLVTQAASATAAEAGPLLILDLTEPGASPVDVPFEGDLGEAAFLPDGRTLVAGSMTGEVVVADARTGEVRETLAGGHNGAIMGLVVSPDGATAWTAGRDGDLIAWDLTGERRLATAHDLPLAVTTGQVSADGTRAAVWAANPEGVPAQVGVLDLADGTLLADPFPLPEEAGERPNTFAAGITPDGATLLRGAVSGPEEPARLQVVDASTGQVRHDVELPWWPNGIAATTDGTAALVAGQGGVVRIDLASGTITARVELPEVNWYTEVQSSVAPSPDGRHVAVARNSEVVILDVTDLREVARWSAGQYDTLLTTQWLEDGAALAFGGRMGRLHMRAFPAGDVMVEPRQMFPGFVLDMAVSPDGTLLALLGTDGEVVLWDVTAEQTIGQPLVAARDTAWGWVRFTPDGRALEALYDVGRAYQFPIDTPTLIARACVVAAREPSPAEWASMHGDRPQRPTCGDAGASLLAQGE
jgi:DNA-binding SARP family transcriptional activator/WD40 repeat protein